MNYFHDFPPATEVADILEKHSGINQSIRQDPFRLEGFLKDVYGSKYKREIFLLVTASRAKINESLEKVSNSKYPGPILWEIISHLKSGYSLEEKSAAWATVVWAIGLKKLTERGYERFIDELGSEYSITTPVDIPILFSNTSRLSTSEDGSLPYIHDSNDEVDSVESIYKKGNSFHNQGKFAEAIDCYDKALAMNPLEFRILSNKGLTLHNQGKFAEAIDCYDKALAINVGDPYIIRRKEHTLDVIHNNYDPSININLSQLKPNQNTGKKKPINTYIIGIIITIGILISGIIVYVGVIDYPNSNDKYVNSEVDSNPAVNMKSTITKHKQAPDLNPNLIDKQSISDFTNKIKSEIGPNLTTVKDIQKVVSLRPWQSDSQGLSNSSSGMSENVDVAGQSMNQFKSELSKAMKTKFD